MASILAIEPMVEKPSAVGQTPHRLRARELVAVPSDPDHYYAARERFRRGLNDSGATALTKNQGTPDLVNGSYVQMIRVFGGRFFIKRSLGY
jgi:hypothetical protein